MASSGDAEMGLYGEVHRRLVQTGEWDRIVSTLMQKLTESGWMDDVRHRGKETARHLEPLKFNALLEQLNPQAQASTPLAVKQEIIGLLSQFLEKQFDS